MTEPTRLWREEIGTLVGRRIAELGTTVSRVAAKADVGESTLRRLIRGRTWPNAATRSRIEIALGWGFGRMHPEAGVVTEARVVALAQFSNRELLLELARRDHEVERRAGR